MINLDNGSVEEFYKDEAKMMVLDILEEYVKAHPNELRRRDIINGILKANKLDKTSAEIKSKVKNLLQGYSMMNASMQSDLIASPFLTIPIEELLMPVCLARCDISVPLKSERS